MLHFVTRQAEADAMKRMAADVHDAAEDARNQNIGLAKQLEQVRLFNTNLVLSVNQSTLHSPLA